VFFLPSLPLYLDSDNAIVDNHFAIDILAAEGCTCVPTTAPSPAPTNNGTTVVCRKGEESSFQLTLTFDGFPSDISWALIEGSGEGGVVTGGSRYDDALRGQTVVLETVCVPTNECYTFVIRDSQGDGLCCAVGGGNYKINFDEGVDFFKGGIFSFHESMEFCVGESKRSRLQPGT
jgi:hypothetical protein